MHEVIKKSLAIVFPSGQQPNSVSVHLIVARKKNYTVFKNTYILDFKSYNGMKKQLVLITTTGL